MNITHELQQHSHYFVRTACELAPGSEALTRSVFRCTFCFYLGKLFAFSYMKRRNYAIKQILGTHGPIWSPRFGKSSRRDQIGPCVPRIKFLLTFSKFVLSRLSVGRSPPPPPPPPPPRSRYFKQVFKVYRGNIATRLNLPLGSAVLTLLIFYGASSEKTILLYIVVLLLYSSC